MMSDGDLIDEIALAFVEAMNNQPGPLSAAKELLATLRASGRLAPTGEGDVVEAATLAVVSHLGAIVLDARPLGQARLVLGYDDVKRVIAMAAPTISAATEARVRSEISAALSAVQPGSQIGPLYGAGISAGLKVADDIVMNGATR